MYQVHEKVASNSECDLSRNPAEVETSGFPPVIAPFL